MKEILEPDTPIPADDLYAAQREELMVLLKTLSKNHESLVVHGKRRLIPEDVTAILRKLKRGFGFSRKERAALTDAGFDLDKIYPDL